MLVARRHDAVAEYRPVALVILAEQAGGEVIAAAMPLAAGGIDVHLHGGFTHIPIMTTELSRAMPAEAGQGAAGSPHGRRAGFDNGGSPCSVRWVYLHMVEEYARHNGHADLLRERIDGATG